jgi:proton glutamate symport protein
MEKKSLIIMFSSLVLAFCVGALLYYIKIPIVLDSLSFGGSLFLRALKMMVIPLVAVSVIRGVMRSGNPANLKSLGGKTALWYGMTSLFSILVGLVVFNIIQPGLSDGKSVGEKLGLKPLSDSLTARIDGKGMGDIAEVFLRLFPTNPFKAMAHNDMLGVITFCLLLGVAILLIEKEDGPITRLMVSFEKVILMMTDWVLKFLPIGVFCLVASATAKSGFESFSSLMAFFFCVLIALALHTFGVLSLLLVFFAKANPIKHFKEMAPAMLTAFGTSSSAATLPTTMKCAKNAGIPDKVSGFTLPLGATVNMDGTALYECVAALFIAQAYGLDLSIGVQFTIVLTALLTSIGVAGIPSASLVAIVIILAAVGLPAEGLGLILITDRVLDMFRTAVNVTSDTVAARALGFYESKKA